MELLGLKKLFNQDEDGAVTVDWVVLTAAIVGLGVGVLYAVSGEIIDVGDKIADDIDERGIVDYSTLIDES
ncbi:hypothetical protein [Celeribacter halophilus]|uniref:Flp pilus assembly protein, pilin Flp n=1 Tax=Celeribacter halophilus TaxID=576117 RepID=A0A1I3MIW1_9RHOB|nr:hypothetical protein [Celeribacter halophilus]PZX15398.1 hypothetical protein LX82_00027 [Celeribacter halophilus]SFI96923.1 hypothetical protein SAMN04488138_10127 [Celeribacter halophilus]